MMHLDDPFLEVVHMLFVTVCLLADSSRQRKYVIAGSC